MSKTMEIIIGAFAGYGFMEAIGKFVFRPIIRWRLTRNQNATEQEEKP